MTEPDVAIARRELLTKLLRDAGEIGPRDRVAACDQLEGGWSRFSHVATVRDADSSERRYVVRVKAPYGLFDTDLVVEYDLFQALEPLELPTPRAFALHTELDNPFGGELFVMEFLHGSSANVWRARDHEGLRTDWQGQRGIARDLVTYAARIHSIGSAWAPAGLPRLSFAGQVAAWRDTYEAAGFNRDPVLEEAFHWLLAHQPGEAPTGLVHGDFRIGNMLIDSGRVTAILDWELAYVGDVRFDLGYIATEYMAGKHLRAKTDLLGAVAEREWFFAEYERLTGSELDRDAVLAFSVLGLASLMSMTYKGLRRYVDGQSTDFRRAWARYGLPGMRQEVTALMNW
ncbi:MAG TPA: phosphotransferase family protein [Solirubrobacteraceae bacterium]|jgi:aminoglycoside phosphotransferase (APT) family kinase protein